MNKNPNNNFQPVKSEELSALDTARQQGSDSLSKIPILGKDKSLQETIANHKKMNSSDKKSLL